MGRSNTNREDRLLRQLRYCGQHWLDHQVLPVVRQTADVLQLEPNMVHRDRAELFERGLLNRAHGRDSYRLTDTAWKLLGRHFEEFRDVDESGQRRPDMVALLSAQGLRRVPIAPAQIAAGLHRQVDEAIDLSHAEGHIDLPSSMVGSSGTLFAVEVAGDSMIGEHILPGDLAILRVSSEAKKGDIVGIALEDKTVTLKRFEPAGRQARLWAANPAMPDPIVIDLDPGDFEDREMPHLIGVFVGLYRNATSNGARGHD